MFRQVFHEDFRRTVRSLPREHPLARQLCSCLRMLQDGHWKGGTRVKQLDQGRRIYEARVNDGDRLLFSPARPNLLLVFDVVCHDAVNRTYRRMRSTGAREDVLASFRPPPDDAPELSPPEEDRAVDPWWNDYTAGAIPHLLVPPDDVWNDGERLREWCENASLEVDLLLTEEQERVTRLRRPVLLHGSAGSGKTTIIVHALHEHALAHPHHELLYVTYHPGLRTTAEELHGRLLASRALPAPHVTFHSFEELCRAILAHAGIHLDPARLFGEAAFVARYPQLAQRPPLPATAAWCEIRGVVKGRVDAPGNQQEGRLLTRTRYLDELGRAEGAIPADLRPWVWELARSYQRMLHREGWHDEMDLARLAWHALGVLRAQDPAAWRMDAVFCDEVQDLTALQLSLLHTLWGGPPARLFLAGDSHQAIYPSAFRWAEISRKFYEGERQSVPYDRVALTRNFRNSGEVLALAEATLTRLKRRLLQGCPEVRWDPPAPGAHDGPPGLPPARLEGSEEAMLATLASLPASAERVIIVASEEQRALVQRRLGDATAVVTVHEFKGLEADCVILWSLFDGAAHGFWSSVIEDCCRASSHEVLTECNRLYVALTRARRYLAVWDRPGSPAPWDLADFDGMDMRRESPAWLLTVQVEASSQDEWLARAALYERNQVWRLAASAYRSAGQPHHAVRCLARLAAQELRFAEAARLMLEAREWQQARAFFERLGDLRGQARCDAEAHEEAEAWLQAAEAWRRAGEVSRECLAWALAGDWERARACLRSTRVRGEVATEVEARFLSHHLGRLDAALRRLDDSVEAATSRVALPPPT